MSVAVALNLMRRFTMRFLLGKKGTSTVEWLAALVLVVAVVGTLIMSVASTTATEGGKTDTWIDNIPDP
jgi:hypothetical protein